MKLLLVLSIVLLQIEATNAQSPMIQSRDLSKTVVPFTKLQSYGPVESVKFGTGFCIDPDCRFIGTNYHVAKAMGKHFKVEGSPVVNLWMGTGPDDDEASKNRLAGTLGKILPREKYALIRDVAVVELRWPLSQKGYHGVPFSNDDLQYGQQVFIYSFPLHWNPKRKLERFRATFVAYNANYSNRSLEDLSDKPLMFSYDPADGKITGGASGGLVVDGQGRVVGILNAKAEQADHIIAAVPVPVFSAFISRIQPYLSTQLFPKSVVIPPASADNYPEWVPPGPTGTGKRLVEADDVTALRNKSQVLSDSMRNFIAVQSVEWGRGDRNSTPEAIANFEVQVIDGQQRFREYPDGTKEMQEPPFPAPLNTAINTGGEWAEMPNLVGNNLKLRINHVPDITMNGETFQVFQWVGQVEDGICKFKTNVDLVFMSWSKANTLDCYGEVWTDKDLNLVRASENYKMLGSWKNYHGVVTFGVVTIGDRSVRVPVTIATQAEYGGKLYWCQGIFSDYHEFASQVTIGNPAIASIVDATKLDQRVDKPQ
jgi:Trypsin-like peptidase domain